jgi:hypothetical protein
VTEANQAASQLGADAEDLIKATLGITPPPVES